MVVGPVLFFRILIALTDIQDFSKSSSCGLVCAMKVSNLVKSTSSTNSVSKNWPVAVSTKAMPNAGRSSIVDSLMETQNVDISS